MPTLSVAPGLYAWLLTFEDGTTANVLASTLDSAVSGLPRSPVVTATRGAAIGDGSNDVPPVLSSLVPSTAALGAPSFTLHVHGTGFRQESTIYWNGGAEQTTFVSATELTTAVDMSSASVAIPIPVTVKTITGQESNALTFTLTPAADPPAI